MFSLIGTTARTLYKRSKDSISYEHVGINQTSDRSEMRTIFSGAFFMLAHNIKCYTKGHLLVDIFNNFRCFN